MHPGMMHWWKYARSHGRGGGEDGDARAEWHEMREHLRDHFHHHGRGGRGGHPDGDWQASHGDGDGAFGVRRPLRFLAWKLELEEEQVAQFARILDELKVERAQAEVDRRRTVGAFADAIEGDAFADAKATEGGDLRVKSAEKLRAAVLGALQKMHAVLNAEQRKHLAYLIRTGALTI